MHREDIDEDAEASSRWIMRRGGEGKMGREREREKARIPRLSRRIEGGARIDRLVYPSSALSTVHTYQQCGHIQ